MPKNWNPLKTRIQKVLTKYGATATLTRATDSGTEYQPTQTDAESTITYAPWEESTSSNQDFPAMVTLGRRIIVSTSGVTPLVGDILTLDSVVMQFDTIDPIRGGETILAYDCRLVAS